MLRLELPLAEPSSTLSLQCTAVHSSAAECATGSYCNKPIMLDGCPAGSMGVEALCKALRSASSSGLKELDLSHTAADDKAAAALAGLLGASRVLERLVLTHTNITDAGAQLLCNALQVRKLCLDRLLIIKCCWKRRRSALQCSALRCVAFHMMVGVCMAAGPATACDTAPVSGLNQKQKTSAVLSNPILQQSMDFR